MGAASCAVSSLLPGLCASNEATISRSACRRELSHRELRAGLGFLRCSCKLIQMAETCKRDVSFRDGLTTAINEKFVSIFSSCTFLIEVSGVTFVEDIEHETVDHSPCG